LFIGDSITDCGWKTDPEQLGQGYVSHPPRLPLRQIPRIRANRSSTAASGGNKIPDLPKRWQSDVLDLRPDVLSIYIGINDVWHGLVPGRVGCDLDNYLAAIATFSSKRASHFPIQPSSSANLRSFGSRSIPMPMTSSNRTFRL